MSVMLSKSDLAAELVKDVINYLNLDDTDLMDFQIEAVKKRWNITSKVQ